MTKIGVISLGCSKNRVNTEQMMYLLKEAGYSVSGDINGANVVLLNTCGFIESAKTEAVETILELVAAKEDGRIGKLVVAGCLPQRHKENILEELPEIDAVIGTGSFDDVVDVVDGLVKANKGTVPLFDLFQTEEPSPCLPCLFGDINAPVSETPRIISTSPIWAYLKIAEGCDNRCAYCCIPDIRGKFRSRPLENIVKEAKKLVDKGIRELILIAQDLTRYGVDLYGKRCLYDLLVELDKIEELKWIRLHYLYPDEFDDELIDFIGKSGKILKYLDIPIQHINDKVLKKMNRRGTSNDIRGLFKRLRERIPGVVLRTSLITGLPGEGEKEFEELCEFIRETKIERVGVFAYSPEEGTPASKMGRPSKKVAERRAERLLDIQSEIMQKWNESRIGTVITVLVEDLEIQDDPEALRARSFAESPDVDGYIIIKSNHKKSGANEPSPCPKNQTEEPSPRLGLSPCFLDIKINGIKDGKLVGTQEI